jgi:hypothetical protein
MKPEDVPNPRGGKVWGDQGELKVVALLTANKSFSDVLLGTRRWKPAFVSPSYATIIHYEIELLLFYLA